MPCIQAAQLASASADQDLPTWCGHSIRRNPDPPVNNDRSTAGHEVPIDETPTLE